MEGLIVILLVLIIGLSVPDRRQGSIHVNSGRPPSQSGKKAGHTTKDVKKLKRGK